MTLYNANEALLVFRKLKPYLDIGTSIQMLALLSHGYLGDISNYDSTAVKSFVEQYAEQSGLGPVDPLVYKAWSQIEWSQEESLTRFIAQTQYYEARVLGANYLHEWLALLVGESQQ